MTEYMHFNLSEVRRTGARSERVYQAADFAADTDAYRVVEPISLAFDVSKDGERFRLIGNVATTLELTCSRCLESFRQPVDAAFDLEYLPHSLNSGEGEREIQEDDLAAAFYVDDTIDLGHLMREQFYLALPMKPLCSELCRGLCPQCGINLNTGACDCAAGWEDLRLAGLKALLKKNN